MDLFRGKKILIVVAHPDDELLGLGASMHKLINEQQVETRLIILGEGITSRAGERDQEKWSRELTLHKANVAAANKFVGYHSVALYELPDNRFDSVDLLDIIKIIEKEKADFSPDIIFTHHGGDVNIDHQRTFQAVITASRPLAGETVKTIICFETPSGTEWRASNDPWHFIPNLFIQVSEKNVQAKIDGMECYAFEKRAYPHPRSPEALKIQAQRWGITVGAAYAEAFCIVRSII